MGKVIISPHPMKTSERIDKDGNIINPRTKQVLVQKEPEYVPPATPQPPPEAPEQPVASPLPKDDGLSVLEQIEATKKQLADLEELKKLKIAQKKKELELLEK